MKIALIGAGGQKFVRQSVVDLLSRPALRDVRLWLMDVDAERLARSEFVARRIAAQLDAQPTIETTDDQRRAVDGADVVLLTFMVGGMKHYCSDTFIPDKYGVSAATGDTVGPGAVMRLIRSAPLLETLATNLRETAPDALVINYANPLAMMVGLLVEFGHRRTIGLCHAPYSAVTNLAEWLNLPRDEIDTTIGGLNHLNFFLRLEHRGRDLYPDLLARAEDIVREAEAWEAETGRRERLGYERVRMEIVKYLGYFPVEGPWHQGEYYPWFRKSAELVEHYGPPTGWAYRFDRALAAMAEQEFEPILAGEEPIEITPGQALDVPIIHALATGSPCRAIVNVRNDDAWVENLPREAVVEVASRVDGEGIHPDRVGRVPTQLAGIMHQHATVHRLAIEGILARDRSRIRQAIQADPLTGAVLSLPRIEAMVDELLVENQAYLVDW